jgi:hypothetical protein
MPLRTSVSETKLPFLAAAVVGLLIAQPAAAATVYSAEALHPDKMRGTASFSTSFTSNTAGAGTIDFELLGYLSLDGVHNRPNTNRPYTDTFSLYVNGESVLSGSFDLGGGGQTVWNGVSGATVDAKSFGHWQGGLAEIFVPIVLKNGLNAVVFAYTGLAQSLRDEGWGIGSVRIDSNPSPVPLPAAAPLFAAALAGAGLLGWRKRRRQRSISV